MNDMFSAFVKTGLLTKGNDLSFEKMYLVNSDNIFSTNKSSPLIQKPSLAKSEKHVQWFLFLDEFQFLFILSFTGSKDGSDIYHTIRNTFNKVESEKYVQNFCISSKGWVALKINIVLYVSGYFLFRGLQEMPNTSKT